MKLIPFTDDHLPAAAELLALRHQVNRRAEPLLSARFEEPAAALKAVEAVWRQSSASGVAALAQSRLAGYMIGTAGENPVRGRHVWLLLAGHAIAPDADAELYREMYAQLAGRWVDEGHFYHLAQAPASDAAALDAWFRLTFAHEQTYGLCPLESGEAPPVPDGIEIRRATPDDFGLIMEHADVIARHQVASPVFGICLPEARVGWAEGWTALLADPDAFTWLAFRDGRLLSYQTYDPAPPSETDLMVPDRCVHLAVAATRPEARGQGLGGLLLALGRAHAREAGYTSCLTDWRVANLLSSRFFPRQGFRHVVYRLSRRIDPRIVWAR
jgi:ribosomal protein S18 acetylase RimI-like enzyme